MKLSNRILASAAVIGALACAPAVAQAGTVNVEEVKGSTNVSVLHFAAAPGEQNAVRVTVASVQESGGRPEVVTVAVTDTGAPLTAGAGCTGGGAPGTAATCAVHAGRPYENEYCGHDCWKQIPGTAWETTMNIQLGDGDDSFDGSFFTKNYWEGWKMAVDGGAGNDTITTGGSKDTIVPGPGNDVVRSGGDVDRVIADATQDGNDIFELGTDTLNAVDDSARTEPLHLADGVLGTGAEQDRLIGFNEVIGGSGNDEFRSNGEFLKGGGGDDALIGSPGADYIYGGPGNDQLHGEAGDDHLYGGEGNDKIEGGTGNDLIEEFEEEPKEDLLLGKSFAPTGGNNVLEGGEGDDLVLGGFGEDNIEGGPGNDRLYGEAGNDTIEGGAGNDEVAGDAGADLLRGGEGNDRLLSAYNWEFIGGGSSGQGIDTSVDSLDCGPGEDSARTNTWDTAVNCETQQIARAVMVKTVTHNRAKGVTRLGFVGYATESEPVTVKVSGPAIKPVSYQPPKQDYWSNAGELTIRPTRATLKKLRRRGHLTVTVHLTWAPAGKPAATETRQVNLVLKKKQAKKKPTR